MYVSMYIYKYLYIYYAHVFCFKYIYIYTCVCTYTVRIFIYMEGGPDREYEISVHIFDVVTVCLNELDSVCLYGRVGQGNSSRK